MHQGIELFRTAKEAKNLMAAIKLSEGCKIEVRRIGGVDLFEPLGYCKVFSLDGAIYSISGNEKTIARRDHQSTTKTLAAALRSCPT